MRNPLVAHMRIGRGAHHGKARLKTSLTLAFAAVLLVVPAASASTGRIPGNVLRIQVVDGAGRTIPNARVIVSVMWPNASLWGQHARSASTQSVTDGSGVLARSLGATSAEKEAAAANGGWLNLTVTTIDANGIPHSTGVTRYVGSDPVQLAGVAQQDGAGQDVLLRSTRKFTASSVRDGSQQAVRPNVGTNCVNYHWEALDFTWAYTRMGSLNSAADTVNADYQYGTSSDITIDTAFTLSGGGWGLSGTAHSGETLGDLYGLSKGSNFHWGVYVPMDFYEAYFYADCFQQPHLYQGHAEVSENGYHNGRNLTYSIVVSQPARNTSHPEWALKSGPDATYTRQSSKFAYYGGGVVVFGASLGAQSGATTFSKQFWKFGHAQTWHYLYGSSSYVTTAPVIYASNN